MDQSQYRQLLQRAEEIEAVNRQPVSLTDEQREIVEAAVEAGLSRESVVAALQERLAISGIRAKVGDLILAKSGDGFFRVAKLEEIDNGFLVRFLSGGEANLTAEDVRPFSLLPGQIVNSKWPGWAGYWDSRIEHFDRELMKVKLIDWMGTEATVHLSDIRLHADTDKVVSAREKMYQWTIPIATAIGGGIIGALIMRSILR